jgi:hypothetical protein
LLVSGSWGEQAVTLRRVSAVTGTAVPLAPSLVMGAANALGVFDIADDGTLLAFVHEAAAGDIWLLRAVERPF